jgi:hypothetical protein
VGIQGSRLNRCEAIQNLGRAVANRVKVVERLLYAQIRKVIAAHFHAQERAKLLILFDIGVFEVSPEGVMSLIDSFEYGLQFPFEGRG